ncbi:MAG: MlaD family protein [Planctomycetaceae bacterium]|nr:MlaD family protein [Planctomycetaceae bacterium]
MESNRTYFKIGVFLLAALAALIGGILYINADVIRGEALIIETYLDESVQGLGVGSSVLYRGVAIGQVKKITFIPLEYDLGQPEIRDQFGRYVVVIMAIKSDYFPGVSAESSGAQRVIQHEIDSGLRFKLSYQGITGIVFMEADYFPNAKAPTPLPWKPKHIYVPSTPSLVTSFTKAVEKIFLRLEKIDVEALFAKMETALDTMTKTLEDAQISEIRKGILALVDEFSKTNQEVRGFLERSEQVPDDLRAALQQFERTLMQVQLLIGRNEPDLEKVLNDMKDLVRNLKRFSEDLKNDPAQLLFSRPPKPSERVQ